METIIWTVGGMVLIIVVAIAVIVGWHLFAIRHGLLNKMTCIEPVIVQLFYDCSSLSYVLFRKDKGPEFIQIMKVEEDGDEKMLILVPTTTWATDKTDQIKTIYDELNISHKTLRPPIGKYRDPQLIGNLLQDFEVGAIAVNRIFQEVYDNPSDMPIRIKLEAYGE